MAVCIVLIAAYQLLIAAHIVRPSPGINQWQSNFVRAQQYVIGPKLPEAVLVGSSLSGRLTPEWLGPEVSARTLNLCQAGGSAQTGLEIMLRSGRTPKVVLAEINGTLIRGADEDLMSRLFHPVTSRPAAYVAAFKSEYQPASVLISSYRIQTLLSKTHLLDWSSLRQFLGGMTRKWSSPPAGPEQALLEVAGTAGPPKDGLTPEDEKLLREQIEVFQRHAATLERAGARIYCYDVPGDAAFANTAREKRIQAVIDQMLPRQKVHWLPEPPPRDWKTSDGVHLDDPDAILFSDFIRRQILTILGDKS